MTAAVLDEICCLLMSGIFSVARFEIGAERR